MTDNIIVSNIAPILSIARPMKGALIYEKGRTIIKLTSAALHANTIINCENYKITLSKGGILITTVPKSIECTHEIEVSQKGIKFFRIIKEEYYQF